MLSGADCGSISAFKAALDDFYLFSGLRPNLQKSQMFLSGVAANIRSSLLDILPNPVGSLPVDILVSH